MRLYCKVSVPAATWTAPPRPGVMATLPLKLLPVMVFPLEPVEMNTAPPSPPRAPFPVNTESVMRIDPDVVSNAMAPPSPFAVLPVKRDESTSRVLAPVSEIAPPLPVRVTELFDMATSVRTRITSVPAIAPPREPAAASRIVSFLRLRLRAGPPDAAMSNTRAPSPSMIVPVRDAPTMSVTAVDRMLIGPRVRR